MSEQLHELLVHQERARRVGAREQEWCDFRAPALQLAQTLARLGVASGQAEIISTQLTVA